MGKAEIDFVRQYTDAGLSDVRTALNETGGDPFEAVRLLISDESRQRFLCSYRRETATQEETQLYNLFRPAKTWQSLTPPDPPERTEPIPIWFTMETDVQKGDAAMPAEEILKRLHAFPFAEDTDSFGIEFDDSNWLLVYRKFSDGVPTQELWSLACIDGAEYFFRDGTVLSLEQAGQALLSFRNRTGYWRKLDWQVPI